MDKKAWDLLIGKIDRIEKQCDKLMEFRGWVLGAACIAGVVGGLILEMIK